MHNAAKDTLGENLKEPTEASGQVEGDRQGRKAASGSAQTEQSSIGTDADEAVIGAGRDMGNREGKGVQEDGERERGGKGKELDHHGEVEGGVGEHALHSDEDDVDEDDDDDDDDEEDDDDDGVDDENEPAVEEQAAAAADADDADDEKGSPGYTLEENAEDEDEGDEDGPVLEEAADHADHEVEQNVKISLPDAPQ